MASWQPTASKWPSEFSHTLKGKFNLEIHGVSESGEEDPVESMIKIGKLKVARDFLFARRLYFVNRICGK